MGDRRKKTYLFFFVALFAEIFAPAGHFGAAHGVFFGREMFFRLGFCVV